MSEAPQTGILTFLFTDLEDSTNLWERFPEVMPPALSRHDALLREAVESHHGHLVKTTGDGLHAVFMSASDGVAAALAGQEAIMTAEWPVETGSFKVRMGLHTGESKERDGDYFGAEVNRAARVMGIGHGGQILVSEVTAALIRKTLPPDLSLEDLGEHGLKGLAALEHIFQVRHPKIPSTFPPLRTLDQRLTNLPSQLNTFIGREKELAETTAILQREDVRLLTLTGPGGTGKTRLGLQVAVKVTDEFEHGTFFLPLAPLRDPSLVVSAIAQLWGLRESGGQTLLEKLQAYLRDKQLLLVLDNFEQVLDAGVLVSDLLMDAPLLKVLATSREALHVYGEHTFFVPPLRLPDPGDLPPLDDLLQYEAVGLFLERAQAARSGFELSQDNAQSIVEICHRLDGLPLAIELAAARVRLLPPEAMLERMAHTLPLLTGGARDLPERQQTLHNAISWSYDLLNEGEKILFRRLAVFASATLEAMETVCNVDGALPASLLDLVESLMDKSLLKLEEGDGEARFQMLETIREYARNVLQEEGESENLQEQHLHFYLQLTEHSAKTMFGPRQAIWMTRLNQERNNLREALEWSFSEAEQIPTGTKMVEAHVQFWQLRGEIEEWSVWINLALEKNKDAPSLVRANLLEAKGFLAIHLTNYNQAKTLFDQSRALFEECEDAEGIGRVMNYQAHVALGQGLLDQAKDYAEKSLEFNQGLEDSSWSTAASFFAVGDAAYMLGDFPKARKNYKKGLNLSEELEIGFAIARRRVRLGQTALALGDFTLAREHLAEGLAVGGEVSDNWALVMALGGFGCLAKEQSQPKRACRLLGATQFQLDSFGGHFFPLDQREYDQTLDQVRTMLHPDAFKAIWEEGRAMTMETAMRYALELNDSGAG